VVTLSKLAGALASITLGTLACGLTSDDDSGTASGGGGGSSGASGSGGSPNGGSGGSTHDASVPDAGSSGGQAGATWIDAGNGLTIQGQIDCTPCHSWHSCWLKEDLPVKEPPAPAECPYAIAVDFDDYPFCGDLVSFSTVTEQDGYCCYHTLTFCD
jgi:hypothetical protein